MFRLASTFSSTGKCTRLTCPTSYTPCQSYKTFQGDIQVAVDDGSFVSAKSLTRLLALGCKRGQTLRFIAEPETDAIEALDQVILAVQQGLGEEVEALPVTSETPDQLPAQTVISNATTLGNNTGIAASSGLFLDLSM